MAVGGADEENTLVLAADTASDPLTIADSTIAPPAAAKTKKLTKELTPDQRTRETKKRGMRRKRTKTKAEET